MHPIDMNSGNNPVVKTDANECGKYEYPDMGTLSLCLTTVSRCVGVPFGFGRVM